jgi:hypothetical protein
MALWHQFRRNAPVNHIVVNARHTFLFFFALWGVAFLAPNAETRPIKK